MKIRPDRRKRQNPRANQERPDSGRRGSLDRLRCLNCGQNIFVKAGDAPPEVCQFCDDMTTWQALGG